MDNYIPAIAFYLLASSITIVFLGLNMFLDRAFKMHFSKVMLAVLSIAGTYTAFIFSQTGYFTNLFNFVAPHEDLFPSHIIRAVSVTWLSLMASLMIVFLSDERKVWLTILGTIFMGSVGIYFTAPHWRD